MPNSSTSCEYVYCTYMCCFTPSKKNYYEISMLAAKEVFMKTVAKKDPAIVMGAFYELVNFFS